MAATAAARTKRFTIWETYSPTTESSTRVDSRKGVIHNVLIVGRKARNRRAYLDEALEAARPLYEGVSVYLDHQRGQRDRFKRRSVHDFVGKLHNVRHAPDGLRADVHYSRQSRAGQLAAEIAERFPERFGFSHHADVEGYEDNGLKVVERIMEVYSVDLVKDPATTDSVFEEVDAPQDETGAMSVEQAILALQTAILGSSDMEDAEKEAAIKLVHKLKAKLLGGSEEESDPADGDATESVEAKILARLEALEQRLRTPGKSRPAPKSAARSTVTESVTPKAPPAKAPQTEAEIRAAWGVIS